MARYDVARLDEFDGVVKKLRRGSAPRLYNLESTTEELIEDAEVLWAAKVKHMTPR